MGNIGASSSLPILMTLLRLTVIVVGGQNGTATTLILLPTLLFSTNASTSAPTILLPLIHIFNGPNASVYLTLILLLFMVPSILLLYPLPIIPVALLIYLIGSVLLLNATFITFFLQLLVPVPLIFLAALSKPPNARNVADPSKTVAHYICYIY